MTNSAQMQRPEIITPNDDQPFSWFNFDAVTQLWNDMFQQGSLLPKTETEEFLHRYNASKSWFDEWSSDWYELSWLEKGQAYLSVTGIAGVAGFVLGMTIPFVMLASGIFLLVHRLLMSHEEHRRERGEEFVVEAISLSQQLNEMMGEFRKMATKMGFNLELVNIEVSQMKQSNLTLINRSETLLEKEQTLGELTAVLSEKTEQMQRGQTSIVQMIERVAQSICIDSSLGQVNTTLNSFWETLTKFVTTAKVLHATAVNAEETSASLKHLVQKGSALPQPSQSNINNNFEAVMQESDDALARARARRSKMSPKLDVNVFNP